VRAVDSFGGNIYLLDATPRQIYKYVPTDAGYNPQSSPYLPANLKEDFSQVVDIAIDGDVWVLRRAGSVLRFRAGQALPFQLTELDVPLKDPTAIITPQDVDAIYIADAGNQRVVRFDKNGKFVRQFKPSAEHADVFNALKSLFVDESLRRFYFVNGSAVYMANVPK